MPSSVTRARRALVLITTPALITACDMAVAPVGAGVSPPPTATPVPLPTPATPAPRVLASPERVSAPPVATPEPTTVATPATTPTPVRPDGEATASLPPEASPSPAASASPGAAGGFLETGRALDLAPSGPAYFVLASRERPTDPAELLFTRLGPVELARDAAGARQVLRPKLFGLHLLGFTRRAADPAAAPDEAEGLSGLPVETRWAGSPAPLAGLVLDADRNLAALTASRVALTGTWLVGDGAPRDVDGGTLEVLLALASFEVPAGLEAVPGLPGVHRWASAAGRARLGVALSGPGRVLGNRALVVSGRLAEE
ncbi:MAG: hypothetical protein VKS61_03600 [Candidatus Sericytochromatia bacterium]|nr:hypothetical protein [Candidatus Sericytochromatia bacterium]